MNPEMFDGKRLSKEYVKKELRDSRTRKPTRRTRPKAVSDKQGERLAFLGGVKAERIYHQLLTGGVATCELCPEAFDSFAAAKGGLDLHHTEKRSQGRGYVRGNMGVDAPRLLVLCCRPCHRELEKNDPRWTSKEAS